jgi:hypothetical protein
MQEETVEPVGNDLTSSESLERVQARN